MGVLGRRGGGARGVTWRYFGRASGSFLGIGMLNEPGGGRLERRGSLSAKGWGMGMRGPRDLVRAGGLDNRGRAGRGVRTALLDRTARLKGAMGAVPEAEGVGM